MPYRDVPAFVSRLRESDGAKFRALEMIVLTGARKNEVLGMTFDEVDLEQGVWIVPASRMKAGAAHVVPLTARAVEIIEAQRALSRDKSGLVFPSRRGRALSRFNAFDYIDTGDATIHGFRSSCVTGSATRPITNAKLRKAYSRTLSAASKGRTVAVPAYASGVQHLKVGLIVSVAVKKAKLTDIDMNNPHARRFLKRGTRF